MGESTDRPLTLMVVVDPRNFTVERGALYPPLLCCLCSPITALNQEFVEDEIQRALCVFF